MSKKERLEVNALSNAALDAAGEIIRLEKRLDEALSVIRVVIAHADKRQRIATAGMPEGDEELYRLDEPEFVKQARAILRPV